MENIVEKIDGFLKTKKVSWVGLSVYDASEMEHREAVDQDFESQNFVKLSLRNEKGNFYQKYLIVNESRFLVFDSKLKGLEKDLSDDWEMYQIGLEREDTYASLDAETQERVNNFRKYLDADKYNW